MQVQAEQTRTAASRRFVSIVMPALNEERFIADAIRSIAPTTDAFDWELLVLDGGSTDRTRSVVEGLAVTDARIRLLRNEGRIQAAALNLAARRADPRAEVMVRADCHATYPPRFVERCVERLFEQRAASVVVPMRANGRGCMGRAIAAAQNSRLGNGGSAHRAGGTSGFVDHGHHAAMDRTAFVELGGYDERFQCNEDAEFDWRLTLSGRRIYLDGQLMIEYIPRGSLAALVRQYYAHGRGRARNVLKHRQWPRLRQLMPVAVLAGSLAALAVSPVEPRSLAIPLLYLLACLGWGLVLALRLSDRCVALSGLAAAVMHLSWGAGFLAEMALTALGRGIRPAGELPRRAAAS